MRSPGLRYSGRRRCDETNNSQNFRSGEQLKNAPDHRRRYPQRAAAWRSGQQHVAGSNVGEGRQFRNRLRRFEDEIGRGVALPQRAIDRKTQIQIVEQRELLRLKNREPRSDRTKAAIALALEELHLWNLHVAGADVVGDRGGKDKSFNVSRVTVTGHWIERRNTRASSIS